MSLPAILKRKIVQDLEKEMLSAAKFFIMKEKQIPGNNLSGHVYACKKCNKEFSTFQALGGHIAGHNNREKMDSSLSSGVISRRSHTCSICYAEFGTGQALGGHMKKHYNPPGRKGETWVVKAKTVSEDNEPALAWVNFVENGLKCNNPTLVTRDFFPREPIRNEEVPMEIAVLENDDSRLDLKLGFAC